MEAQFGEFQFAYSITREIEDKIIFSNLGLGMPHIPNLREEQGGGFDVSFKGNIVSVFLQYKIPEKLTRSTASEWREMSGKKYYRFHLYPASHSPQHNNLCRLARKSRRNQVFYCAPAFIEYEQLADFHNLRCVSQNSVFINCYYLPEIEEDDRHNICYKINPEAAVMNSEPRQINMKLGWPDIYRDIQKYKYEDMYEFLRYKEEELHLHNDREEMRTVGKTLSRIGRSYAKEGVHMLLLKVEERCNEL